MPDRQIDYLRLDEVQLAPRNPKGHDTAGIARSISHFGFAELPLRDDRTGRLVAGHGRHEQLQAMHTAGGTPPDGVKVADDGMWLMPVLGGWSSRSDDDAEAYLVGSNQLTVKGGWDEYGLTAMLQDLADSQLLELTGYDAGDLDAMLALVDTHNDDHGLSDEDVLGESDKAAWPLIRAQVSPEVHQRWQTIDGDDDAERIRVVMDMAGI